MACRMGTEHALHTVRQWKERNTATPDRVLLKIDFANAFNCVSRSKVLSEVQERMPSLARWVQWCYGSPSHLVFGDHTLESRAGVQQGDPLGPLLFSLAIHQLAMKLRNMGRDIPGGDPLDLTLFYLDDGLLCGSAAAVAAALRVLEAEGAQIGLQLKMGKCELVVPSGRLSHDARRRFPPGLLTDPATGTDRVGLDGNFEFLGAPVGSPQYCAAFVQRKVDAAAASLQALGELQDPQVGLRLLRLCGSFCKMVYLPRTVPHEVQSAPLQEFDAKVRDTFCSFTGF